MKPAVYLLLCNDGKYYVGSTSNLEARIRQHEAGIKGSFTYNRRPLSLTWHTECETMYDAGNLEKQIKKWTRAKKAALAANDLEMLRFLSKSRSPIRQAQGDA